MVGGAVGIETGDGGRREVVDVSSLGNMRGSEGCS